MTLYPANLKLDDRLCTVIGGGRVAVRKVQSLLECQARVKVVSPELVPEFDLLTGCYEHVPRPYQSGDLTGSFLAIAATDDEATNRAVEAEAGSLGILLNVVDKPDQCNFYVPSTIRRGELMITISTGGQLPALAKRLRQQLEQQFPIEWSTLLKLLGEARLRVIAQVEDEDRKIECLTELASLDLLPLLAENDLDAAQAEIDQCISRY